MPLSLRNKILAALTAALLVLGVVGLLSYRSTLALLETEEEQNSARDVIVFMTEALRDLNAMRGTIRGYYLTGDSSLLPMYERAKQDALAEIAELERSPLYPHFKSQLDEFGRLVEDRIELSEGRKRAFDSAGLLGVTSTMNGDEEDRRIQQQASLIETNIRRNLVARQQAVDRLARLTLSVIALGTVLALIFVMILALVIVREVEQRQQAHREVGEREERLNDLIENANVLIQTTAPDGRITGVNRTWTQTLGYSAEQAVHLNMMDIVHPDSRARWREAVARALEGERVLDLSIDLSASDGSPVNVIGNLSCRFIDGLPAALRVIFQDLTQTREAEAELREQEHRSQQILEHMPLGVFVVNAAGTPLYANQAAIDLLGRGASAAVRPDQLPEFYSAYCAGRNELYPVDRLPIVRALNGQFAHAEDIEIDRAGTRVPLTVTATPIYTSEGQIAGAIAAFSDITERRQVERMKDELISVVSHELRTPLTSIRGALGLIGSGRLGTLTDQGRKMIDIATTDTDRLVRLINDMLDIERLQSGRLELHKTTCEALDLLEQAADAMRPLAARSNVFIEYTAPNVELVCDTDRILQTLTNLIGNAIKFSPPNGTVNVTARVIDHEVEFRVRDQGRGIPAEKLDSIFERFQQVDASDAREKGGAGLGLAISRSIVIQHGGRIWAESDGATGSTFVFTLPKLASSTQPQAVPVPAQGLADDDSAAAGVRKAKQEKPIVLIVEDDDNLGEVLAAQFTDIGLRAINAPNGAEALRIAQEDMPDLLVLDLMLPDRDGFAVVSWLRQHERLRHLPLVVYTAKELDDAEKEQLTLGPSVFMTKSKEAPQAVVERVTTLLNTANGGSGKDHE